MNLKDVTLQEIPALLNMIADYRKKLRVNNANTLDLTTFAKSIQPNYNGDALLEEILKLDNILAKHELHYMGEMESVIANYRSTFNVKNANGFPFYSEWLNGQLEDDVEAFNNIISIIEHKIDHRFPVLNVDSHSALLSTALSPADPHYILTKKDSENEESNYNKGLFQSLKNYRVHTRLLEVAPRLPQEQFNLILSTQGLSQLGTSQLPGFISQFYKLLRPGGILLVSFLDVSTPLGFRLICNWYENRTVPPINSLTKDYFIGYVLNPIKDRAPFVVEDDQTFEKHTVLMLRKPGQLKTVKNRKTVFSVKAVGG